MAEFDKRFWLALTGLIVLWAVLMLAITTVGCGPVVRYNDTPRIQPDCWYNLDGTKVCRVWGAPDVQGD